MLYMTLEEIKDFLRRKNGYIKFGAFKLSTILDADEDLCYRALGEIRKEFKNKPIKINDIHYSENLGKTFTNQDVFKNAFELSKRGIFPRDSFKENIKKFKTGKNVLVIGDLHLPFTLKGYLEHCIETYYKHNCNEVVFIGDIIDNHASSYHETDPDGHSAGQELKLAIQQR